MISEMPPTERTETTTDTDNSSVNEILKEFERGLDTARKGPLGNKENAVNAAAEKATNALSKFPMDNKVKDALEAVNGAKDAFVQRKFPNEAKARASGKPIKF
jgi:hypothetical protein